MSKKYLSAAFAYVGVIVGAGLASGQDLLQYFLAYGAIGLIGIVALGVLNIIFGAVALQLGSYYRSDNHDVVFEQIARPALRRIIDVVLVFSAFTMGFVMLAVRERTSSSNSACPRGWVEPCVRCWWF